MYIDNNREEAMMEKKLYVNFTNWLDGKYINGMPSPPQWIDIMSHVSEKKISQASGYGYGYSSDSDSSTHLSQASDSVIVLD